MEQSGVLGLKVDGAVTVEVIRNVPFCTHEALAQMVGVTDDTARGWVEMGTIPTAKIGRRRVVFLARMMPDSSRGKRIYFSPVATATREGATHSPPTDAHSPARLRQSLHDAGREYSGAAADSWSWGYQDDHALLAPVAGSLCQCADAFTIGVD